MSDVYLRDEFFVVVSCNISFTVECLTLLAPHFHKWRRTTQSISGLPPNRDWGPKRVDVVCSHYCWYLPPPLLLHPYNSSSTPPRGVESRATTRFLTGGTVYHTYSILPRVMKILNREHYHRGWVDTLLLTPLEPQSRFGDKLHESCVVCPQNGAAVLEGLILLCCCLLSDIYV